MNIEICKWFNDYNSPVLLMVDDLANAWVDINGNGKVDLSEDWGFDKNNKNSSFRFLNDVVLKDFPQVKITFYVPVGVREGMLTDSKIKFFSRKIDYDEETKSFFKYINDNPKFEIAYHGTTHGKAGKSNFDFLQEWETFTSLDEAVETINKGKEIYKEVFGVYPKGGKYCGYKAGEYGDKSIDKTGFLWWNRYWNKGMGIKNQCDVGEDTNPLTNFDIKTFGENNVIDIPSTIEGSMFNGYLHQNMRSIKGIIKRVLKPYIRIKKNKELQYLLDNKLVISIQEHISPAKDDGTRQQPNIFDDKSSLDMIFRYLKDKNVWYCTATELAEYYLLRESTKLVVIDKSSFRISTENDNTICNNILSVKLEKDAVNIVAPNGEVINVKNNIANIKASDGIYKIKYKK